RSRIIKSRYNPRKGTYFVCKIGENQKKCNKKNADAMQYANFAYTCRKFSSNSYYDYQTEYREETYRNQFPQFECRIARGRP
ncbi:hypothetical protein, partial [uncultured Alistipes sp.]|uniref:hypothetical protein n=1 Tax=uncultured Alistipes sp. TaxID=538949 RepID=UPI0025E66A69